MGQSRLHQQPVDVCLCSILDERWKNMQPSAHSDDIISTLRIQATERFRRGGPATGSDHHGQHRYLGRPLDQLSLGLSRRGREGPGQSSDIELVQQG